MRSKGGEGRAGRGGGEGGGEGGGKAPSCVMIEGVWTRREFVWIVDQPRHERWGSNIVDNGKYRRIKTNCF